MGKHTTSGRGGNNDFLASTPQTAKHLKAANSATQALLTCASQGTNELEGRRRRRHDPSAPRTHRKPCKHTQACTRRGQGHARCKQGWGAPTQGRTDWECIKQAGEPDCMVNTHGGFPDLRWLRGEEGGGGGETAWASQGRNAHGRPA